MKSLLLLAAVLFAADSYMPVTQNGALEPFEKVRARKVKEKGAIRKRQMTLLERRYDLSDRPSKTKMFRGKPVQEGVRAKLPRGVTWDQLAELAPEDIRAKGLWPEGFLPLPHPHQEEGGMVFPKSHIEEVKRQEDRDLTRFDLDLDIPEHFLPEFPPPVFLTTRPDLGDVSKGKLLTSESFFELLNGILNPKDLDGLRLLLTPFPQQQFNVTEDRRSDRPHRGVTCLDCHANGHTNGATHLVGDIRPQELRRRIDVPSLRGLHSQQVFGSQRALKTVEDFTEFEQRAAYFDGDTVIAMKKGINVLDRGAQVHHMAEIQNLFDFPPAPKLDAFGRLDPAKASEQELRGEKVFFGKGRCSECHAPPAYTDNQLHDLKVARFYGDKTYNGRRTLPEGPIKTFPLRGIKESPPYLHDGRLLTLPDAVEFFNLVLGVKLSDQEKKDLVAFLEAL